MSFVETFNALPLTELRRCAPATQGLPGFAAMLAPTVDLEELAQRAHAVTLRHFGRVIRLYAPLYLSNECINICKYCGFSRDNPILRVTLTLDQVEAEARYLQAEGFRHILLVAGEHPHFVSNNYLRDCVARLRKDWPSVSLEVGPLELDEYRPIVQAGAEGLVVYQETYDRTVYKFMHTSGPKMNFDWRLETAERAYAAGFKRIGIGALLGLADWRTEAICLAAHVEYLLKKCWQSQITISVPRLRPAAGEFEPLVHVTDRELAQFICAMRLTFPEVGIVLSTREPANLRDGLIRLGVTMISAGSHTEPGGYTGQGKDKLHLTKGGRHIESEGEHATVQFEIADNRSPAEVAGVLAGMGYEAVWKDWDNTLNG
ncbi:MAG: 2-iminoacetate synthase [Verrucomicrobiae bacterium]|nr:2-iminoacetate synthase [Verrucomicrobiae bacterium]